MAKTKKLFDEITRDYTGFRCYTEPKWNYLNRCARLECERIRNLLEQWFKNFPSKAQDDLRKRFQSKKDQHHLSAFFELYLHELLSKSGFSVEIHPVMRNKSTHPDFKVLKDGKPLFYLEVKVVSLSDEDISAKARENQVYKVLNRIKSPNSFIGVKVQGTPVTNPPGAKMRRFLECKLSNLDLNTIAKQSEQDGFEALPQWEWKHDDWQVIFFPIPKKLKAQAKLDVRPIGLQMYNPKLTIPHIGIKQAIQDKAIKYGELDLPYIVAINIMKEFGGDDIDISNALFGEEQVALIFRRNELIGKQFRRKPNGAWYGPNGPQNKRVSAVLIAVGLTPWEIAKITPVLWHNPWARNPLPLRIWRLPQVILNKKSAQLRKKRGKKAWQILGLYPDWPE